uniref:Uncharacterized protein n=1 Tax=Rhizophora mucronata TaxID=61149 RepID=A0A2P2QUW4_RHIMU
MTRVFLCSLFVSEYSKYLHSEPSNSTKKTKPDRVHSIKCSIWSMIYPQFHFIHTTDCTKTAEEGKLLTRNSNGINR